MDDDFQTRESNLALREKMLSNNKLKKTAAVSAPPHASSSGISVKAAKGKVTVKEMTFSGNRKLIRMKVNEGSCT